MQVIESFLWVTGILAMSKPYGYTEFKQMQYYSCVWRWFHSAKMEADNCEYKYVDTSSRVIILSIGQLEIDKSAGIYLPVFLW